MNLNAKKDLPQSSSTTTVPFLPSVLQRWLRLRALQAVGISRAPIFPLLDPLTLIHNKAAQATALRAYSPPEKCGGLETATLAMG